MPAMPATYVGHTLVHPGPGLFAWSYTSWNTLPPLRLRGEFQKFMEEFSDSLGVLLIEPQWGSSIAALPWPKAALLHLALAPWVPPPWEALCWGALLPALPWAGAVPGVRANRAGAWGAGLCR